MRVGSVFVLFWCGCVFSSCIRQTSVALVTGVQTCALPSSPTDWVIWAIAIVSFSPLVSVIAWVRRIFSHGLELACRIFAGYSLSQFTFEGYRGAKQIGRASCRERVCQYV